MRWIGGRVPPNDVPPAPDPAAAPEELGGMNLMMMWPAVTLLGFLVLTALVIAMGTQSTARYEREREELTAGPRQAADAVGAVSA